MLRDGGNNLQISKETETKSIKNIKKCDGFKSAPQKGWKGGQAEMPVQKCAQLQKQKELELHMQVQSCNITAGTDMWWEQMA